MSEETIKIFYSYARKDRELRDSLDNHLAPLRAAGKIDTWHDLQLEPGSEWKKDVIAQLETANIILLLISADFMASEYCYSIELKLAIDRHNAGQAKVIPVILRPCDWNQPNVLFYRLNVLPTDAKPVVNWPNPDDAYKIVAQQIRETVEQMGIERQNVSQVIPSQPIGPVAPTTPQPAPQAKSGNLLLRRNVLGLIGLGGVGTAMAILSNRSDSGNCLEPNSSSASEQSSSPIVKFSADDQGLQRPDLKKIPFTSVRLDELGKIVDRPTGNAEIFEEILGNGVMLTMLKIPAGEFTMGQSAAEKTEIMKVYSEKDYQQYFSDEGPQHLVKVPEFYLGQNLVTQAQWQAVMGNNPSHFRGDQLPVEQVRWLDAMNFCAKLSQKTGHSYRLPSEAEWEYACRARAETPFAFGPTINPDVVNYNGNYPYGKAANGAYREKTTEVGKFPPNAFGLYHMHGNLWEWCLDEYCNNYNNAPENATARGDVNSRSHDRQRLLRGGDYSNSSYNCRSAVRHHMSAVSKSLSVGLRVVMEGLKTPSSQNS